MVRVVPVVVAALLAAACATLGQLRGLVQAPHFEQSDDRPAELRLLSASATRPLGGATLRLWTDVTNPNPFGFTLSTLRGSLFLEDDRAAEVDLPLGLRLTAGTTETFPIDISIDFADLPALAAAIRRAIGRQPIQYRIDGTVGVDAGTYGTPEFGPMTLLRGTIDGRGPHLPSKTPRF